MNMLSVPTCMNKPVNNHVQAGQLNRVHACQQAKTSCAFLSVQRTVANSSFTDRISLAKKVLLLAGVKIFFIISIKVIP